MNNPQARPSRPARLARLFAPLLALPLLGWVQLTTQQNGGPPLHWTQGANVLYHVHSAGYSQMPLARVRGAIDGAFTSWEMPCTTLHSSADPQGRDGDTPAMDGQSVIRFEERALPPEIDGNTVLAYTMHTGAYCTGVIAEADITFNAVTFTWGDGNDPDRADIETVGLHEIGHVLGLGHSAFDWAVMYPSIVDRVRRGLSQDETDAICTIYDDTHGETCDRDAQCVGGEQCMVQAESDQTVDVRCGAPVGGSRVGQRCDGAAALCDNGCGNGLCLQSGVCSAICHADADCPRGWLCLQDRLPSGQTYGYCANLALCEADVGACPAGQVCTVTERPSGDALLRLCIDPPGAGGVGDACRASDGCHSGLCVGGDCSQPCDGDADCPAPFTCLSSDFSLSGGGSAATSLCQIDTSPCVRDADCGAGLVCHFRNAGNSTVVECGETNGGGPAGVHCQNGRDCESGFCLSGTCSGPCAENTDCPDGMACSRAPVFSHPTAACVNIPAPGTDASVPPPPPDAAISPPTPDASGASDAGGAVADAAGPEPTPDARALPANDSAVSSMQDAVPAPGTQPGAGTSIDAGAPVGAVRRTGGGNSGCQSMPGIPDTGRWAGLAAAAAVAGLVLSRRRRRAA